MARNAKGHWLPGTSGHEGHKKTRTASDQLTRACKTGNVKLGKLIRQGLLEGRIVFPDGRELVFDTKEWREFVDWYFTRVDGKPVAPVDVGIDASESVTATIAAAIARIYAEDIEDADGGVPG